MLVKATTALAKALNANSPYKVVCEHFSREAFGSCVDYDLYSNEVDYSPKTGKFSAIAVHYPPEMFASPQYFTTRDLLKIFRTIPGDRTLTAFTNAFNAAAEI